MVLFDLYRSLSTVCLFVQISISLTWSHIVQRIQSIL